MDKTLIDEEVLIEVPIQTPIEVEFSKEGATAADPIEVPLEVMLWPSRKSPIIIKTLPDVLTLQIERQD